MEQLAALTMQRLETLGAISEEPQWLTRMYGSPALRNAQDLVAEWMRQAGMRTWRDSLGNLIGRREGADPSQTIVFGGHLDTVRNAGKYDGTLGVLAGLAVVELLAAQPPVSVEVVAFADEESLRFPTMYLGSSVYTSQFDTALLESADAHGVSLEEAVTTFGGDPHALRDLPAPRSDVRAFVELHIEQGPVLEAAGLPVGVVTAIAGASRFEVEFNGVAGHAGTVPMALRRDALVAAAACVSDLHALAGSVEGLVATVGSLVIEPGARNVIPGRAVFSMDIRHESDAIRIDAVARILQMVNTHAEHFQVDVRITELPGAPATPMNERLVAMWTEIVAAEQGQVCQLVSGAGHDAVKMAHIAPVSMLFLRCRDGVSHNPAESITEADVAVGIRVLRRLVDSLPQ